MFSTENGELTPQQRYLRQMDEVSRQLDKGNYSIIFRMLPETVHKHFEALIKKVEDPALNLTPEDKLASIVGDGVMTIVIWTFTIHESFNYELTETDKAACRAAMKRFILLCLDYNPDTRPHLEKVFDPTYHDGVIINNPGSTGAEFLKLVDATVDDMFSE